MRSITDMNPGDYVKTGTGVYEKIVSVNGGVKPDEPLPKHWSVTVESGRIVDMYEARSYHKASDLASTPPKWR